MGIVNIEDELHDQLRRASKVSCRSINAQAAYWIRIGMLCELNPGLPFQEVVRRELREAGVDPALPPGALPPGAQPAGAGTP
ncbi:ParD-like family protein [Novosphingobium sp. YJ-S2-02]|uniref:ParD-like family protein n=1 Tax=Novosphingobium aureum TaxID=2792964 RepID=A0A931H934_9SPHN|nr:ParD-like family protein [Novosphingobium aureum]MBH0111512.1 ParD-like family protein [Novosphingobium aureum]